MTNEATLLDSEWRAVFYEHDIPDGSNGTWRVEFTSHDISGEAMTIVVGDWLDEETAIKIVRSVNERDALQAENARLREALEVIAGRRLGDCGDNLMSGPEIAESALSPKTEE